MSEQKPACVYCERSSEEVPLVVILFKDENVYICPQHLPLLIHKPAKLADKMPGVEKLGEPYLPG